MQLIPLAPGLWTLHHEDFSVGGLRLGTRTNILTLRDGTLALHCPGPLDAAAKAEIGQLGAVSTLIVPSRLHHLFVQRAQELFPEARVVATDGVPEPALRVDEALGPGSQALSGVAEVLPLDGCPRLGEQVLFLPASRTLLAVDLAFHIQGARGFLRFAMCLNNANDRFCVTRLGRSQFVQDRAAAARSVTRMVDAWDIDRVVIAHGAVLETGGRDGLREAWRWAQAAG